MYFDLLCFAIGLNDNNTFYQLAQKNFVKVHFSNSNVVFEILLGIKFDLFLTAKAVLETAFTTPHPHPHPPPILDLEIFLRENFFLPGHILDILVIFARKFFFAYWHTVLTYWLTGLKYWHTVSTPEPDPDHRTRS